MMKPAQPRQRSHYGVFCWLLFDDAMIRRVLRQRIVNSVFVVQLSNTTPILETSVKSAIRGIPGTAGPCVCMPVS